MWSSYPDKAGNFNRTTYHYIKCFAISDYQIHRARELCPRGAHVIVEGRLGTTKMMLKPGWEDDKNDQNPPTAGTYFYEHRIVINRIIPFSKPQTQFEDDYSDVDEKLLGDHVAQEVQQRLLEGKEGLK